MKTDIQEYNINRARQAILLYCQIFICLCLLPFPAFAGWRLLAPGIEYQDLTGSTLTPWSHIHVFRVNLSLNQLDSVMASKLAQPHASAHEFAHHTKGLITINGGFFDQDYHPLGLRISNQKQNNPLKRISWWGIFYTKDKKPYLTSLKHYQPDPDINFAVQSGPRLLIGGNIPALKPGLAERTALGITRKKEIIILVTENSPMTTTALAELMKSSAIACNQALNLDGGGSTQLAVNIGNFHVNVHGFSNISDAIVVKPRIE